MDEFGLIVFGGMAALIGALLLLGRYYPGSGADVLDWKPTRSIETEVELEIDDIAQMLEAKNVRRRRRGEPDLTEEDIRRRVADDLREQHARFETEAARREDVAQMLEAANQRRRARGEPDLTEAQLRAELGLDAR